jgi:hypothetical protein
MKGPLDTPEFCPCRADAPEKRPCPAPADDQGGDREAQREFAPGSRETYLRYARAYIISRGAVTMAKPIELGLTLEGEDARRFHEYMERPTYTDDARKLIRLAAQDAQNRRL